MVLNFYTIKILKLVSLAQELLMKEIIKDIDNNTAANLISHLYFFKFITQVYYKTFEKYVLQYI